jgi:hypothetical protein
MRYKSNHSAALPCTFFREFPQSSTFLITAIIVPNAVVTVAKLGSIAPNPGILYQLSPNRFDLSEALSTQRQKAGQ